MGDSSLLAQTIDIHQFLEQDRALGLSERAARDRAIGRELLLQDDTARVLAWWRTAGSGQLAGVGDRVVAVRRWIVVALIIAGVFTGGSAAAVALAYDGSYPVNLLAFMGVMVGLPLLLLVLTFISMLLRVTRRGRKARPRSLQLNGWLIGLWERLSGNLLRAGYGQSEARGRFAYWQALLFSQVFSVGFFVGALAMLGVLVAVTDLAFGWSTTLQLDAARVYGWVARLAAPWAHLWPQASPDLSLVEASRFYRLEGSISPARAARLGEWWPFVLMSLMVWGLVPRCVMFGLCRWRLTLSTRALLREHSEVTALGEDSGRAVTDTANSGEIVPLPALGDALAVVWNDAAPLSAQLGASKSAIRLDSQLSERELQAAIETIPEHTPRLLLVVKAWEPPMLEVLDLLQLLRGRVGADASIVIAPVGVPEGGYSAQWNDLAVWSAAVAKLKDPSTYVAQADAGVIEAEQPHA